MEQIQDYTAKKIYFTQKNFPLEIVTLTTTTIEKSKVERKLKKKTLENKNQEQFKEITQQLLLLNIEEFPSFFSYWVVRKFGRNSPKSLEL